MLITEQELKKQYGANGKYAPFAMPDRFKTQPRLKGEKRKYLVEPDGTLPSPEELQVAMRKAFMHNLDDLVADAESELSDLKDELQEWYDNLPPQFQEGEKGDQLQEAIDALDSINNTECEPFGSIQVYHPPLYVRPESRGDRRDVAVAALQAAQDALEEVRNLFEDNLEDEAEKRAEYLKAFQVESAEDLDFETPIDSLSQAIEAAEGVEFPRMV